MAFTLATLRTAIRDYTEVDSNVLTDSILNTIILNAEARIFRTVDADANKFYATSETVIGIRYVTVPTGTRIIRSIQITNPTTSNQIYLKQVDQSFLAEYAPDYDNVSDRGLPKYYAHWDEDNWVVAPTPDAAYTLTMAYIKHPQTITLTEGSSTDISNFVPDLLLYACLVETFKYLKGPENMLQQYETSYQEAIQTYAAQQQGRRRRDEYRDGALRIPIQSPSP